MQLSMWTYPWDIADLGIDVVSAEIRDRAGLNRISIATSYHAGRFLQPRSASRKTYFPEDGTVYYRPDAGLWAEHDIRPRMARHVEEGGDTLAQAVTAREAGGLAVSAWTVCLHNTRLGLAHPGHVTRNAFGDPNWYNLCPSSPAARAYAATLVGEITRRYRPDAIEIESPNFLGFAHGFHHEKDGVGLLPEDDLLMSLCFCGHCAARAARADIPFEAARATTARLVAAACERAVPEPQFPDFPETGIDAFAAHPELQALLRWRFEPVTSLLAELREAADPASKVVLVEGPDPWLGAIDVGEAARHLDGAIICAYGMTPEATMALMRRTRAALGPDAFLGCGQTLFYPQTPDAGTLAARMAAALAGGADGFSIYNYGLVPAKRLDWVGAAVRGFARAEPPFTAKE